MTAREARDGLGPVSRTSFLASPAVARVAPFAVFMAFVAAQPLLAAYVDARWLAVSRGVVVAVVLAFLWRHYTELRTVPRVTLAQGAAALLVGTLVFGLWIALDQPWASFEAGPGFDPRAPDGTIDATLVALRLAGMVLVVPVMEELFWRSFVMRWIAKRDFLALDPRHVGALAFALSSALFALEHALWLAGLLAGLAYAALYVATRNLWVPILSHAVTNGILGIWILATRQWHLW